MELHMKLIQKHPIVMIMIGVLGISLSSIFLKYSTAPSVVTATFRLLWTVLFLTPVVVGKKNVRLELKGAPLKACVLSALSGIFLAAHFVLWFESISITSIASSTTIVCTEVIWVALGFCFFMGGRLGWKAILAILASLIGSIMIAFSDSNEGASLYGDILALLAAIAVGIYTLIGRIVRKTLSTTAYTYIVYASCLVALLFICLIQGYSIFSYGISPVVVGILLALFSTILGHSIFSWCLKYFSPAFVSASKLCEPVVAAIFAAFLFGEIPGVLQIAGAVFVLSGVLFYSIVEAK